MRNVSRYRHQRALWQHNVRVRDALRVEIDAGTKGLIHLVSRGPSQPKPDPPPDVQLAAARRLTSGYLRHGYVKHARDLLRSAA